MSSKLTYLSVLMAAACISACCCQSGKNKFNPSDIYVSPSGDDTSFGNADHPFRTITHALEKAEPGSTIWLQEGTWNESVKITVSGTEKKPITLAASPGANPILDGGNGEGWNQMFMLDGHSLMIDFVLVNSQLPPVDPEKGIITIEGASHIILKGLTITGSGASGIYCSKGASNITVKGCTVTNCVAPGICFGADGSASSQITVIDNYVKNCAQRSREAISLRTVDIFEVAHNTVEEVIKECIDAKSGCSRGSIHHNHIRKGGHVSIYVDSGYADRPEEKDIDIYSNIVENPFGTGICVAAEAGNDCSNIRIFNNLVYSTDKTMSFGAGIKVAKNDEDLSGRIKDIYIYENTVCGLGQQGIYVNYPTIDNVIIANNISAWNMNQICVKDGVSIQGIIIDGNLVFGEASHPGESAITADPGLNNPTKGDFSLGHGSPALDAAKEPYVAKLDIADKVRPAGKGYDIGAYERVE